MESKGASRVARMGCGNVRLIGLPNYCQILVGKFFRVRNGTGVLLTTTTSRSLWVNHFHFSKDSLMATHSSFILPKESPLVVSQNQLCKSSNTILVLLYFSHSLRFVGLIFSLNNVAEGHRSFGQAGV